MDTDGEDAMRIWVILDESVDVEKLRPEDITAVKSAIRDRVFELGVGLWPCIYMAKQRASWTRTMRNEPCMRISWSKPSGWPTLDAKKPKQANLCRAISAAYYAEFHLLVDEACRVQIGAQHHQTPFRQVLGRAFTHSIRKEACK